MKNRSRPGVAVCEASDNLSGSCLKVSARQNEAVWPRSRLAGYPWKDTSPDAAAGLGESHPGTAVSLERNLEAQTTHRPELRIAPSHCVISAGAIRGAIFASQPRAFIEYASGPIPVAKGASRD